MSKTTIIPGRKAVADHCKGVNETVTPSAGAQLVASDGGEPWFVASDVAKILGYKLPDKAIRDHCKAASNTRLNRMGTSGGNPNVSIIPERDVYRLIMRSKLPGDPLGKQTRW